MLDQAFQVVMSNNSCQVPIAHVHISTIYYLGPNHYHSIGSQSDRLQIPINMKTTLKIRYLFNNLAHIFFIFN